MEFLCKHSYWIFFTILRAIVLSRRHILLGCLFPLLRFLFHQFHSHLYPFSSSSLSFVYHHNLIWALLFIPQFYAVLSFSPIFYFKRVFSRSNSFHENCAFFHDVIYKYTEINNLYKQCCLIKKKFQQCIKSSIKRYV